MRHLNSIGFIWRLQARIPWMDMFHRLVTYKEEHNGPTMVPHSYDEDPQLGQWVHNQRDYFRNNKTPNDQVTLLKSIHFARDARKAMAEIVWIDMYQRLVSYQEEHDGSTLVPQKYINDLELGKWVSTQRLRCKQEKRVQLLNDIDFVWNARKKI